MPHQNVESGTATAQNAATEPTQPNDPGREQNATAHGEARAFTAADPADASLAPPAAGEVADYMDEGDAFDGEAVQSGGDRTRIAGHSRDDDHHGAKTTKAIRDQTSGR